MSCVGLWVPPHQDCAHRVPSMRPGPRWLHRSCGTQEQVCGHLHYGDGSACPEPSFPQRKPGRLLAALNNGIQEVSMGGRVCIFSLQISIPWI